MTSLSAGVWMGERRKRSVEGKEKEKDEKGRGINNRRHRIEEIRII